MGLLFAGVTAGVKRKRILEGFKAEVDKGRSLLNTDVSEKLKSYISQLKSRIEDNFNRFDQMLETEESHIRHLETLQNGIAKRLDEMKEQLKA